jgi:hypothetical protein
MTNKINLSIQQGSVQKNFLIKFVIKRCLPRTLITPLFWIIQALQTQLNIGPLGHNSKIADKFIDKIVFHCWYKISFSYIAKF